MLKADDKNDGIPLLKFIGCGRDRLEPLSIRGQQIRRAAERRAQPGPRLERHCRHLPRLRRDEPMRPLAQPPQAAAPGAQTRGWLPAQQRRHQRADHVRGQGPGVSGGDAAGRGQMPAAGEDEKEEARVFYVAATRATQRLVIGVSGDWGVGWRLMG